MANITFTGSTLSFSFEDTGRSGFTFTHVPTGYTLTCTGAMSKYYSGVEWQPESIVPIAGGYRTTYDGDGSPSAIADYSVETNSIGIKLRLTSLTPDEERVDLLEFNLDDKIGLYTIDDFPIVRLTGGFVLALCPLTDSTSFIVRAGSDDPSHFAYIMSYDPALRDTKGGGAPVRDDGVYIILCPENDFLSTLAAVEIELGLATPTANPSLAKSHPYNNHDYLFLLGNSDENGDKISDDTLIAWCNRMGLKQVMFGAWLWYVTTAARSDSPYSLVDGIKATLVNLRSAGISTIAHSYVRGPNYTGMSRPFTGSWWSSYNDSLVYVGGHGYYPDVKHDNLIELAATAYADAVMEAGFDGIYWDGRMTYSLQTQVQIDNDNPGMGFKPAMYGEVEGRTQRAVYARFYENGFYPKIFQSGETSIYYYLTRAGQTDLWEGASNPRWGSVTEFIDDINADAIRNNFLFPDFGWWGRIHTYIDENTHVDRYPTRAEWESMAAKSLSDNIPIGYRTWYSNYDGTGSHMDDPDRDFIEQLLLTTTQARTPIETAVIGSRWGTAAKWKEWI